jgi:putative oxidoreductase
MGRREIAMNIMCAFSVPLRVYLGMVFVLASLYKIYDPRAFALTVATYQMAPLWTINLFALILPMVELVVGVALILGMWTRESALLTVGMMLMFLTALGWALHQEIHMSCGCFASSEAENDIGFHTVARDLIWLSIATYIMIVDDGRFGLDRFLKQPKEIHDHAPS